MPRPIEYRAWDKEKRIMLPVKLMDFSQWWVSCDPKYQHDTLDHSERNSFRNEETDRHILMQYIGVPDDHGTKIFESDIVQYWHSGWHVGIVSFMDGVYIAGNHMMRGGLPSKRVLGNIYEYPTFAERVQAKMRSPENTPLYQAGDMVFVRDSGLGPVIDRVRSVSYEHSEFRYKMHQFGIFPERHLLPTKEIQAVVGRKHAERSDPDVPLSSGSDGQSPSPQ